MVGYFIREMVNIIEESDWIDRAVKDIAKDKASSIVTVIGYPEELLTDSLVEEHYAGLDLASNDSISLLDKMMQLRKWKTDKTFSSLGEPYTEVSF